MRRLSKMLAVAGVGLSLGGAMSFVGRGEAHPQSKRIYSAVCEKPHGVLFGGGTWEGPIRDSEEEAQKDADSHNKEFEGHKAWVFSRPE